MACTSDTLLLVLPQRQKSAYTAYPKAEPTPVASSAPPASSLYSSPVVSLPFSSAPMAWTPFMWGGGQATVPQQGCSSLLGRDRGSLVPTGLSFLAGTPVEQRTLEGLEASLSRPWCLPYPPEWGEVGTSWVKGACFSSLP